MHLPSLYLSFAPAIDVDNKVKTQAQTTINFLECIF